MQLESFLMISFILIVFLKVLTWIFTKVTNEALHHLEESDTKENYSDKFFPNKQDNDSEF